MINGPDCRLPFYCRILQAVALVAFIGLPAEARAFDICDDQIEIGEPHEVFRSLGYLVAGHVLAEKVCGASPTPLAPRFLGVVERDGCGPGTAIHLQMEELIASAEKYALKLSTPDSDAPSSKMAQEGARASAEEFGGCKVLREVHDLPISPLVLPGGDSAVSPDTDGQ
jgi:hypothetical protein